MRLKAVILLLILAAPALAACGRKDVPDYPPDSIERPGTMDRDRRHSPRYY
jgi:predicted small lipoprotein YifL